MSPELGWLLHPAEPRAGLDCRRAVDLAISHGLAYTVLPHAGNLSPDCAAHLHDYAKHRAATDLRHRGNLVVILRRLAEADIVAVPFKGPVLADRLYPAGATRLYQDLDILVQPRDVNAAIGALRGLAYRPAINVADPCSNPVLRFSGEMTLRSSMTRSPIDLHWRLFGWDTPRTERFATVWSRVTRATWTGESIHSLDGTDLAAYLCFHGSKHLWLHLRLLQDLARLFETKPSPDWDRLLAEAVADGRARFLLLGPWLVHTLLHASIPASWLEHAERDGDLRDVAAYIVNAMETPDDWPAHLSNRSIWTKLLGTRRAALRYRCMEALAPSPAEWKAMPLPQSLSFLYYPYRPLRLAGVRLGRLWAGIRRASAA